MGGLAHYIEEEGIATTQISLVREHTEIMRPPRALWVPFELGRPFGVPGDADFQRRVLRAVLALLERTDGPVILEDYPEDAPAESASDPEDMSGWVCPVRLGPPPGADAANGSWLQAIEHELAELAPWYELAVEKNGRTGANASGLTPSEAARHVASFLSGEPDPNPRPDLPAFAALKLATEDLKAYYMEALSAQPGRKSTRQLVDWFWRETAAARAFVALRDICLKSEDEGMRYLGIRSLVPRSQEHLLK